MKEERMYKLVEEVLDNVYENGHEAELQCLTHEEIAEELVDILGGSFDEALACVRKYYGFE